MRRCLLLPAPAWYAVQGNIEPLFAIQMPNCWEEPPEEPVSCNQTTVKNVQNIEISGIILGETKHSLPCVGRLLCCGCGWRAPLCLVCAGGGCPLRAGSSCYQRAKRC